MEQPQDSALPVYPWDYRRYLKAVDPLQARLSRGFLACRPEKWFPSFATQWLPLAHSLGVEFKVIEVKPALQFPKGLDYGYACLIDGESAALLIDAASAGVLLDAVVPGAVESSQEIVLEYLARRCLGSLALAWSGPETSFIQFDRNTDAQTVKSSGAVKFSVLVNNTQAALWIILGSQAVQRLDGLWRRQVRSTAKRVDGEEVVSIEIGQLAVSPSSLVDYTKSGTLIDLETPVRDTCTLRLSDRPWMAARLCAVNEKIGLEMLTASLQTLAAPEGTTRLSVQMGSFSIESAALPELSQAGAVFETDLRLGTDVQMLINKERVADATLCVYEGRFAISVK